MKKKVDAYLGLAKRAGKLVSGYNTCIFSIKKGQAKLIVMTEDVSENTLKKITSLCEARQVPLRVYGRAEKLSYLTGTRDRGIFAVTSTEFSIAIIKEIDNETNSVT